MSQTVVYISGPITKGDREHNFAQAAAAHRRLFDAGYSVINPILTMRLPWAWDVSHDAWMRCDLPIVSRADAVLRLPGESNGADIETAHAVERGIPVYHEIDELLDDEPQAWWGEDYNECIDPFAI